MLAEGSHGANCQGLYVVSGPQGSPPGLVIQGIEGPQSPLLPGRKKVGLTGLASPVSPTFFLPGSPGVSPGPAKGWKMIGPNPDGEYMLVKDKSRPDDAGEVDPCSSQGNLPRGATRGKRGVGQPGVPVTAFGMDVGKSGVGHVTTVKPEVSQVGMWQPGVTQIGSRQVSTNQYQETPQTADTSGILKASGINSPKEDTTVINTIISS
ncbi:hypothetical protein KUCAC02_033182 [Chaenocephalus aceratus]|nr:hypothetical protein KUCAC02_033182 [Chaenocephalus aceratus]